MFAPLIESLAGGAAEDDAGIGEGGAGGKGSDEAGEEGGAVDLGADDLTIGEAHPMQEVDVVIVKPGVPAGFAGGGGGAEGVGAAAGLLSENGFLDVLGRSLVAGFIRASKLDP